MKRDILIFLSNVVIVFFAVGIIVNAAPLAKDSVASVSSGIMSVLSPYEKIKSAAAQVSLIFSSSSVNNNNTSQEESVQVMNSIGSKDGSGDTDLTQTPDDILKLMEEEQKVIDTQKVKGKTSEESYTGGGTIVTFENVQVQSKIPEDFYTLNIEKLLEEKADLKISDASQPTVLIYHSHSTESYTLLDAGFYTESSNSKTKDISRNMVRVGDEICKILEERGIGVIHDREIHDSSYNEAYDSSRKSVQDYLEKYPSIEITIDVHRDSITYKNGTKVKPTATVNDKKAAKMMIISGCEYGSVENFPNWEDNLRFSCAVTNKLATMYDGLMRPILFSERKYNMDLTKNSFLLEIGTDANTLDEACYSGRLFADALAELLLEEYTEN
ncbi:MAG: stage II sporulation protein P [Eubacterium sp.]|uniref:stage II sporulation protein P n=1 Tax=Eubacterium sp. TaxID=142586 RepID=UPI003A2ECE1A